MSHTSASTNDQATQPSQSDTMAGQTTIQIPASLACHDEQSAMGSNLAGVLDAFVELHIPVSHLLFSKQIEDPEDHPQNPVKNRTYGVYAKQRRTEIGKSDIFDLTDGGDDNFLPGLSARFECDTNAKGWDILPEEENPRTRTGVLVASYSKLDYDGWQKRLEEQEKVKGMWG